jgi:hypothetical protein
MAYPYLYYDEYVIWNYARYGSGDFTSPVSQIEEATERTYGTETVFGSQETPYTYPAETLSDGGIVLESSPFSIEAEYYVAGVYNGLTTDPNTTYTIVGQFDDTGWFQGCGTTQGNYWALEFVSTPTGETYYRYVIYDQDDGIILELIGEIILDLADVDSNYYQANNSTDVDTIAVSTDGETFKLFINGILVDTAILTETFDTPSGSLVVNGQSGYIPVNLPTGLAQVYNLVFTDEDRYSADYSLDPPYWYPGGIAIGVNLHTWIMVGAPGDIWHTKFSFKPRVAVTIDIPPYITDTSFNFAPRVHGSIAYLGEIIADFFPDRTWKIPMLTFEAEGWDTISGTLNITLPMQTFTPTGRIDETGIMGITLPTLVMGFSGDENVIGTLSSDVPILRFSGTGAIDEFGTLSFTLPSLTIELSSDGGYGEVGDLDITLPAMRFSGDGADIITGAMDIDIPMINILFTATPTAYLNMVMNIFNKAMTLYTNYNYNSLCQFKGVPLGATKTKIYNLNYGDDDDGAIIDWNFQIGFLDLEQKYKKKLRHAWMSYKSNGDLIMTVVLPDGTEYEYELEGIYEDETGMRCKFGKGIRSKYIAIDVKNVEGSTLELDSMMLYFEKVNVPR